MVKVLARVGLAAKGVVYLLIGAVALVDGRGSGKNGTLAKVAQQPFGRVGLLVLAAGLICHVLWRFAQAFGDTERKGKGIKGLCMRAGYAVLGFLYCGLTYTCAQLALMRRSTMRDDQTERSLAGFLLEQPFGRLLLVGVGIGFAIAGVANLVTAVRASFVERLQLTQQVKKIVIPVGRFGTAALALACFLTATFFFFAADHSNAREAKGLAGAMRFVAQQPLGSALLAVFAAGLFAYGAYQLMEARYRRLR